MFNENINDNKIIIPSKEIIKLYFLLMDVYQTNREKYKLNEMDMQKTFNNYDDKYLAIDKIVMLIYGVTSVYDYTIQKETISKDRIPKTDLSEKEQDKNIKDLTATVTTLNTNVGELVIGYDYAYIKKPIYSPNVELTERQQAILNDENINFNIEYPYIKINSLNNTLQILPILSYEEITGKKNPKYSFEYYEINITQESFKHFYSHHPIKFISNICTLKNVEELFKNKKLPCIEGFDFYRIFDKQKDNKYRLVLEYLSTNKQTSEENEKTKQSYVFQFIYNNDYSLETVYYLDEISNYVHEKTYFVNYYEEKEEKEEIKAS